MVPLLLGLVFALFTASCLAFVERGDRAGRKKYFIKLALWFVLALFVGGWAMRVLPL